LICESVLSEFQPELQSDFAVKMEPAGANNSRTQPAGKPSFWASDLEALTAVVVKCEDGLPDS
jgi:hypothetical protein